MNHSDASKAVDSESRAYNFRVIQVAIGGNGVEICGIGFTVTACDDIVIQVVEVIGC